MKMSKKNKFLSMTLALALALTWMRSPLAATERRGANADRSLFPGNGFFASLDSANAVVPLMEKQQVAQHDREVERVGKMVLAGIALNLAGIFGGWAVGDAVSGPHMSDHIAPGSPMAALIGSALGSSLGVFLAGNTRNAPGKFGSALAGSLLGTAAAIVVTMPFLGLESGVGIILGLVAWWSFPRWAPPCVSIAP